MGGKKRGQAVVYNDPENNKETMPKHELKFLEDNFKNLNKNSYHDAALVSQPGIYWTDVVSPGKTATQIGGHETNPGLFGIQLPKNWIKYTSRRNQTKDALPVVTQKITYGVTPAENDTSYYNPLNKIDNSLKYDFYKLSTNYNDTIQHKKGGCMYKHGKKIPTHETGSTIAYSKPEVQFLKDNFGLIDWTNYHKAGAVRPGNYVSYVYGDNESWENVKTKDGSQPALLGIQLPNGYEKLTQKYNPITGELMGEELIRYGETEAQNDTVPYGSSFYKRASNYSRQKASNKQTEVNTRP